ncbi:MAG: HAD-IC family P-type ATPase [Cyclobacteriaceae bacterium]|nr:HAD-IC family P-type ATPase [Cyclobacteriaceae bacterium HetDA_MAG_MS6]
MNIETNTHTSQDQCELCGKPCADEIIAFDDHAFCCAGCKSVYQLLSYEGNELLMPDSTAKSRRFDYLDLAEVRSKLLIFESDTFARTSFNVPAIHCSSCVYLIEQLPQFYSDVLQCKVNFSKKEVEILFQKKLPLSQLVQLLAAIGYEPAINLGTTESYQSKRKSAIGIKIAVAGFCFGNIMLLSLPEYLDHNFLLESKFKETFSYINLLLSLPVIFYSATDYFRAAIGGLGKKVFTIDVPIVLGILTLFGRSLFEVSTLTGSGYFDSLAGLVFFLLIGKWYQQKTYNALSFERDYKSYFPMACTRVKDGSSEQIHIKDLHPGDLIQIHSQELIPVDGILESKDALLDYSFVTGESEAINKSAQEQVFAGGRNIGQQVMIRVAKTVDMSYLTGLWNNEAFRKGSSDFQNLTDKISRHFTLIILTIAVAAGSYWWLVSPEKVWGVVTAVMIVACPCALALALPFTYGHALRIFGRHGLYLKNAEVVELLAKVSTFVFDKTGTLTYQKAQKVVFKGKLNSLEEEIIASVTAQSSHPLSRMICESLDVDSMHHVSNYKELTSKGVEAKVLKQHVKIGSAQWLNLTEDGSESTRVFVQFSGKLLGYFEIQQSYREGLNKLLISLKDKFHLMLLSGDQAKEEKRLAPYFKHLHFNLKPIDKLHHIKRCQSDGETVAMIGDGLNDAGALKTSDIGIALSDDVHQFSPACDAILASDSFTKLKSFARFAKGSTTIVILAFIFSFLYNIVGLSFAVTGHLSPLVSAILMPISSVSVVGFAVLGIAFLEKKLLHI